MDHLPLIMEMKKEQREERDIIVEGAAEEEEQAEVKRIMKWKVMQGHYLKKKTEIMEEEIIKNTKMELDERNYSQGCVLSPDLDEELSKRNIGGIGLEK